MTRATVPEVRLLVQAVYLSPTGGVGCCLHIAMDDGNVEDSHIELCLEQAKERGHATCLAAAEALRKMTKTQRRKLYHTHGGYEAQRVGEIR